jgi:hypothetical protein
MSTGLAATIAEMLHDAMMSPMTPAASDNTTRSVRSCRTSRARPAPSAARIAISLRRPALRARIRLAAFAHAISSTAATAESSTVRPNR